MAILLQQKLHVDLITIVQSDLKIKTAQKKLDRFRIIEQLANQAKSDKEAAYRAGRITVSDFNQALVDYRKRKEDT